MGKRSSLAFGVLLILAACGADATATETADDLTDNAPESLADASGGVAELTTVTFVDEINIARPSNDFEDELSEMILEDLNALGYQWESAEVVVDAPSEQTGDVSTVSTYTATAWTTVGNADDPNGRIGARVVYDMTTTSRVTTADGEVLEQAIVNDCLNLDFCPDGVSRDTVNIERVVNYDRANLFANCRDTTTDSEDGAPTVICE